MPAFIVAYDLKKQGQNYDCIIAKLEEYGTNWHMQGSVWIIETSLSAVQIRDDLKSCLDPNDNVFVARLSTEAAWQGLGEDGSKWLKSVIERGARPY